MAADVLTAYLFDRSRGQQITDWVDASRDLTASQVLWVDLQDPSGEEAEAVRHAFDLASDHPAGMQPTDPGPALSQHDGYIYLRVVAAPNHGRSEHAGEVVESFVGADWLVTAHTGEDAVIDAFRTVATGAGQLGLLDAPSFLATLLDSVVASYSGAFSGIEEALEDFDADVLHSQDRDVEGKVTVLLEARQRVGELRRALAPHHQVFANLSHPELNLVSSDESARRFSQLASRVDDALASARDAKQAVVSSFDMLILRTEHRTNEVVKILTLTSILLLPGALIAGLMGMNVNLAAGDFTGSGLFWGVLIAVLGLASTTLVFARVRRWI